MEDDAAAAPRSSDTSGQELLDLATIEFRDISVQTEIFTVPDSEDDSAFKASGWLLVDERSHDIFYGTLPVRRLDATIEQVRQCLARVPDEEIFPLMIPEIAVFDSHSAPCSRDLYIKRPRIDREELAGTTDAAEAFLREARYHQAVREVPHRNLVDFKGCIVKNNRIVGIVLQRYFLTLKQYDEDDREAVLYLRKHLTRRDLTKKDDDGRRVLGIQADQDNQEADGRTLYTEVGLRRQILSDIHSAENASTACRQLEDQPMEADNSVHDRSAWFERVMSAVTHLHALGIAHNDIKPSNIMLDDDFQPILIDLGGCMEFGETTFCGGTHGFNEGFSRISCHENDYIGLAKVHEWLGLGPLTIDRDRQRLNSNLRNIGFRLRYFLRSQIWIVSDRMQRIMMDAHSLGADLQCHARRYLPH